MARKKEVVPEESDEENSVSVNEESGSEGDSIGEGESNSEDEERSGSEDEDEDEDEDDSVSNSNNLEDPSREDKMDDLTYDVYNLTACDYHQVKIAENRKLESQLKESAQRATQLLFKRYNHNHHNKLKNSYSIICIAQ